MVFAYDTEVTLAGVAALVNTLEGDRDHLTDPPALDDFVQKWGWTGRHEGSAAELAAVRSLRPRLRGLWELDKEGVVALVNDLLRDAGALPQLVQHGDWGYHLHATPPAAPLDVRMAVEAAMAFTDVVRSGELGRLGICAYPGCDNVVIDLSKNRSKRYCDSGCGNRAAVKAYRSRKRAQT